MTPIDYRPVSGVDFDAFTTAFNLAYSDYFMPVSMTAPGFRALFERDDLNPDASVVALAGQQIVGTGLLGIRHRAGWIGGMGVIPEYRRQGIGRHMMRCLLAHARERSLTRIALEVIEENTGAYALYREMGFIDNRFLLILERSPGPLQEADSPYTIETRPAGTLLPFFSVFHDTPTCWQCDSRSLQALASQLQGWAAVENGAVVGYALGWASEYAVQLIDLAVTPTNRRADVAHALLAYLHHHYPHAYGSRYNIPADDAVVPGYRTLNYTTTLRQIEMLFTHV